MQGLILHCGAQAITKEQVSFLPVAQPQGARHAMRPFIEDINTVTQLLAQIGRPVAQESYGVPKDKSTGISNQCFGSLVL